MSSLAMAERSGADEDADGGRLAQDRGDSRASTTRRRTSGSNPGPTAIRRRGGPGSTAATPRAGVRGPRRRWPRRPGRAGSERPRAGWAPAARGGPSGALRHGGLPSPSSPWVVEPPAEAVERDVILAAELELGQAALAIAADDPGPVGSFVRGPGHHRVSRWRRDAMAQSSGRGDRVGRWGPPDVHALTPSRLFMTQPFAMSRPRGTVDVSGI